MGWYEEFSKTIGEAARQRKGSGYPVSSIASPRRGEVFFTKNAQVKMKQWGLSEADALDVYHHSSMVKNNMVIRKHNGFEVGIWFFADRMILCDIVSSCLRKRPFSETTKISIFAQCILWTTKRISITRLNYHNFNVDKLLSL